MLVNGQYEYRCYGSFAIVLSRKQVINFPVISVAGVLCSKSPWSRQTIVSKGRKLINFSGYDQKTSMIAIMVYPFGSTR